MTDAPAPEPAEAAFDAEVARAGLVLTPAERAAVLEGARRLHRAAALVRDYVGTDPAAGP